MEKIKASEVSAVLKQQLENFDTSSKLEEVGTVLSVSTILYGSLCAIGE